MRIRTSDRQAVQREGCLGLKSLELKGMIDYEQKYEEDPPGEEAGEYARVWLTYLDETDQSVRDNVDSLKDTIDVLLVFAGLFSAVVTAFVIESTQNLQTDYTQVSANLLFELVQIQREIVNEVPAGSISPSLINPNTPFIPTLTDSLVNGLWFTSLALALATALLAVLTKQWLYQYTSATLGTPRERSRLREFRTQGLETWNVPYIVGLLPVLLHIALALFLTGLVIFLIPLKTEIAWTVGVIAGVTYICYVISALLPIFDPRCPYTTFLTTPFRFSWTLAHNCWHILIDLGISYRMSGEVRTIVVKQLAGHVTTAISSPLRKIYRWFRQINPALFMIWANLKEMFLGYPLVIFFSWLIALQTAILVYCPRLLLSKRPVQLQNSREREIAVVQQKGISVDIDAISSLNSISINSSVRKIINRSICTLPYGINRYLLIENGSLYKDLSDLVHEEDCLTFQVDTLRRLILAWLHYGDTINGDIKCLLDSQKIEPYDPQLAKLCDFLKQENHIDILIISINGDTTTSWPLVVWSFLFRDAEHQNDTTQLVLAKTLLTWKAAENLFTWRDDKITLVYDQEPITLSQLSTKYPHIVGKWIFNYLFKHFHISIDRDNADFILLGDVLYTRYFLFRTIYGALTRLSPNSSARTISLMQNCREILSLVQNFKTYVTCIVADESGLSNALNRLARVFEEDIMWSKTFFEDSIMPQTRAHLIQIYNTLRKAQGPEPGLIRENTMRCIHNYLVRLNASVTIESETAVLHLLQSFTVVTLPEFFEFLCDLEDPRLDLIVMHSRGGMTGYHAMLFLCMYIGAQRSHGSPTLRRILYNPSVLEELCRGMVSINRLGSNSGSEYFLDIARLNPLDPGWKDCYKRLLNLIQEELRSFHFERLIGEDNLEGTNPPFHQVYRKEWFSLYLLCYHLRFILKENLSGDEITLRKLPDMYPETFSHLSQDQIRKFNDLVLEKKKRPFIDRLDSVLRNAILTGTWIPNIRNLLDENDDNLFVQTSPV